MRRVSRVALVCVVALVLGCPLRAQAPVVNYFTLTIDNTSGGLGLANATWSGVKTTAPTVFQACSARLETAEVRYRYDGTGPTSTEGQLLEPLEQLQNGRQEFWQALRLIRTTANSATLKGQCWSAS